MSLHAPWFQGARMEKVLIINCNHDQIPSPKVIGDEGIEEERRLFFVGMTRAELELLHNLGMENHQRSSRSRSLK